MDCRHTDVHRTLKCAQCVFQCKLRTEKLKLSMVWHKHGFSPSFSAIQFDSTCCLCPISRKSSCYPMSWGPCRYWEWDRNRSRILRWVFFTQKRIGACRPFCCYNDTRCALSLSRFDDLKLEHLGDFILLDLVRLRSSPKWCEADWSRTFRRCLDLMRNCLNSPRVAIPHGLELRYHVYKLGANFCVIIWYSNLPPQFFSQGFGFFDLLVPSYLCLPSIWMDVLHEADSDSVGYKIGQFPLQIVCGASRLISLLYFRPFPFVAFVIIHPLLVCKNQFSPVD